MQEKYVYTLGLLNFHKKVFAEDLPIFTMEKGELMSYEDRKARIAELDEVIAVVEKLKGQT